MVAGGSGENLVPIMEVVARDDAIKDERIALDEFFRRFAGSEHTDRSYRRVAIRPGHQQDTALVEFVQTRAMGREMLHRKGKPLRCGFIEHQDLHGVPVIRPAQYYPKAGNSGSAVTARTPFARRSTGRLRTRKRRCSTRHLGGMHFRQASTSLFLLISLPSFSQDQIDLHAAVKQGNIEVYNRDLSLIDEPGHSGIRLSKAYGEGVAWLKGVEFSNGVIEFDVRGEDVRQHSFVGIAFHGANDSTFDAIYLRPFQFRASIDSLRLRMMQYISLPEHTWRILRAKSPGVYEHSIEPAPDPNAWVHMRVEVESDVVSVFINGARQASLVVQKVTNHHTGRVGLYVADTSGGDFANITIAPIK